MEKRKKFVLFIIVSFLCLPSFAQMEVSKPDRFLPKIGLKAGLTLSNFYEADEESVNSEDYSMNIGFHAGLIIEIPIGKHFSFESGLLFSTKGYNYYDEWYDDSLGVDMEYYNEYKLYYLDIPITFKGGLEFSGITLYGAAGPYLGIGIGGFNYYYDVVGGIETDDTDKISWGNADKNDLKQLDYGLVMGLGIEFKGFQLGFSYYIGLRSISTDSEYIINNRVTQISLAYKFGKIE